MIQCPECGHEVSSKASVCPECGVRIAGNVKRCPICNTCVLMAASECPHCHTQFVVPKTQPAPLPVITEEDSHMKDTPPQEPKKHRPFLWKTLVFIFLIAGCIALYLWVQHENEEAKADAAFALLERCNDPQNFHDFILHYPNSKHIPAVRARITALEQEEKDWQKAQKSGRLELMKHFLTSYPTSVHRQAAMNDIDSLEWRVATATGTSAAYTAYITAHDNGDYITQAFAARDSALRCELQARNDSIAAAAAANADSIGAETLTTL